MEVGGKWVGPVEEMNMGVFDRKDVEEREIRKAG